MRAFVFDYECYFSRANKYTLSHMNPAEYILDDRFEVTGLAVKELGCPRQWIEGPDVAAFLSSLDPDATTTISHNQLFDAPVSAYRYGFVPKLLVCTLGIARAMLNLESYSLKSVAEHLRLPAKGEEIHQADGMRLADLKANPDFYRGYIDYALNDGTLCEGIYNEFVPTRRFPPEEIRVQDLVLRCAVLPVLHADVSMLKQHLADLRESKQLLLDACGHDRVTLMSATKFKDALEDHDVVVKTKTSPTGNAIAAFSKTDPFMAELTEHQDAGVQALAKARLAFKSTQEETRAQKFLDVAALPWPNGQPMLPIPLIYAGAKTHRLAGGAGMNLQNLARDTSKSKLRSSIVAPKGFKIISADSSQVEARIAACICGQTDLLDAFRQGIDVYAGFASSVFGRPITKKDNPVERFIGKTGILSLQYGSGWLRFHLMVTTQAGAAGIDLQGVFDEQVAQRTVRMYRELYNRIPACWRELDKFKQHILLNDHTSEVIPLGPATLMSRRIRLPNGLFLRYDGPPAPCSGVASQVDEKLWGGTLLNHICQSPAYVILMQAARRLNAKGLRFVWQVHDELIFCVPDEQVEKAKDVILAEMIRPPSWLPELSLAAEIGVGDNYGGVKAP